MAHYQILMDKIYPFVQQYNLIGNSQIVDFFTKQLWDNCVPVDIQNLYEKYYHENWDRNDLINHVCIKEFYNLISSFELNKMFSNGEEEIAFDGNVNKIVSNVKIKHQKFHSEKKWHEIELLSDVVNKNIDFNCPLIVDAGAGKGYLSTHISQNYNLPVLAIETSKTVFNSALNYKDLLKKKTRVSYKQVKYVKEHITESTDYSNLAKCNFPEFCIKNNLCLIGLHTCGSLVYSMIKSFLNDEDIRLLCVVPCCYHLADSSFNEKYRLSRNQRMLAQQRSAESLDTNSYHPSLFYRAVLQVILTSLGLSDAKIGRGLFHEDFIIYAKRALTVIGVPIEEIPSDESLKETFSMYRKQIWKFNIFHTLRLLIAPLLEITILLDIALHLQKSTHCKQVKILRVFNNNISPRSYCIVGKKS